MLPCEALERAEHSSWRTVTFAILWSGQERTTDTRRTSGRRGVWRHLAIFMVAIVPMLQGCRTRNTLSSDHFDGSRFHNRAGGSDYSLWDEIKIGWELRTKKKNWSVRFHTPPYQAPAAPVL